MHIILGLTYLSIKVAREGVFSWKMEFVKIVYSSIRELYCCYWDFSRVPPERASCKKLIKTLKNHSSWLDYSKFAQTLAVRFLKSFSIHPICINACGSFSFKTLYLKFSDLTCWYGIYLRCRLNPSSVRQSFHRYILGTKCHKMFIMESLQHFMTPQSARLGYQYHSVLLPYSSSCYAVQAWKNVIISWTGVTVF